MNLEDLTLAEVEALCGPGVGETATVRSGPRSELGIVALLGAGAALFLGAVGVVQAATSERRVVRALGSELSAMKAADRAFAARIGHLERFTGAVKEPRR